MSTISLSGKRSYSNGWTDWGDWANVNKNNYISAANRAHSVYRARVDWSTDSALTACTVSANIACGTSGKYHGAVLSCYLYQADPTGGAVNWPPAGYIGLSQKTVTVPYYGIHVEFDFSGLEVPNGVNELYFWILDDNNSEYMDYIYHRAANNCPAPSVTAEFLEANMALTLSPETASTGSSVTASIANGAGTALTLAVQYNGQTLQSFETSTGTLSLPCSKGWFDAAGVTLLQQMTLTVEATGGRPSPLTAYLTLNAGEDMRPTVQEVQAELVQPENVPAGFAGTAIAGMTRARISAAVTLATDSPIDKVLVSSGGNSVEATQNAATGRWEALTAPMTGDSTYTVTATDKRGLSGRGSVTVEGVVPYTPPSVAIVEADTWRCDASGQQEAGGAYFRVRARATYYEALAGNSLKKLTAEVKGVGTETALENDVQSGAISGGFDRRYQYTILVTVQDQLSGEIQRELKLPGITRNVVVRRTAGGTHVGIGTTPLRGDVSSLELAAGGVVRVGAAEYGAFLHTADGSTDGSSFEGDLLNINRSQRTALENASSVFTGSGFTNSPVTGSFTGYREVLIVDGSTALVRILEIAPQAGREWTNGFTGGAWGGWKSRSPA